MNNKFHSFLHQQILVLLVLSLFPGLGYILLGWIYDDAMPAIIWYVLVVITSIWGYRLHRAFLYKTMTRKELAQWNQQLRWFCYTLFSLWTLIFLLYCKETESKLHYIAIFTQIGASVVASTLLYSDKKLYVPILVIMMVPLTIYFAGIQQWYGYVLCIFSYVFLGVLLYGANSSNKLLFIGRYLREKSIFFM